VDLYYAEDVPCAARLSSLVLCSFLSAGCANSGVAGGIAGGLPDGFEVLDLPRSSIPIGARWRHGVGPDGPGAPRSELERIESAANLSSNRELAQGVEFAVTSYLGIEVEARMAVSVEFSGLTIERLASLNNALSAGSAVLYEGLKAARIKVSYDAGFDASIQANAAARGIPVIASSDTATRRSLTLDGKDLFLAYRVVKMGEGRVRRWRKSLVFNATVKKYDVRLDTQKIESCMCRVAAAGESWASFEQCAREVPANLQVVNYARVKPDGSPYEGNFAVFGHATLAAVRSP